MLWAYSEEEKYKFANLDLLKHDKCLILCNPILTFIYKTVWKVALHVIVTCVIFNHESMCVTSTYSTWNIMKAIKTIIKWYFICLIFEIFNWWWWPSVVWTSVCRDTLIGAR